MPDINNPEKLPNLFHRMRGLIIAASPKYPNEFNEGSKEIWSGMAEFICSDSVSVGAKFSRTRRLSDFQTLPRDQSFTTLFIDHNNPSDTIEVAAEKVLELVDAPFIEEDMLVFSINFNEVPQISVVSWPLSQARPILVFTLPAELQ